MCEIILNLTKSTSHSRTIRLNSAHFAQRRKWFLTQHKVQTLKQCWHDATTRRFSSTIFSAIVMWKILSLSVNMINMNEEKKWNDKIKKMSLIILITLRNVIINEKTRRSFNKHLTSTSRVNKFHYFFTFIEKRFKKRETSFKNVVNEHRTSSIKKYHFFLL
jgi:transcriptional regulator of met regulon